MSKEKARYFTFLLYPESIPEDWEEKLELLGVPIAISPLHDMDEKTNKAKWASDDVVRNGKHYKKPHYHGIYVSKNPVTADSIRLKFKRLLGEKSVNTVQIITTSIHNTYLYLTHESKDAIAKNKYKYKSSDIKLFNNFDIDRYNTLDVEEKDELFEIICEIVEKYQIANILELGKFVRKYGSIYGLNSMRVVNKVIVSKTGLMRIYFDGAYQARKNGIQEIELDVDLETGELKGNENSGWTNNND
ncbi:replication protein [Enterococcus asini]|uniref:replication protein n=1 Tax=Enterococcus asini TaxID=57732 RepID=UPI00288FC603|nr:replication protein [Enterococcus asini]MDT2758142.1 replication protein [Enterococcus asini]